MHRLRRDRELPPLLGRRPPLRSRSSLNPQLLRLGAHLSPTAGQGFVLTTLPSPYSSGGCNSGTPTSYPDLGLTLRFLPLLLFRCASLRHCSPELCCPRLRPCHGRSPVPGALPLPVSPLLSPPVRSLSNPFLFCLSFVSRLLCSIDAIVQTWGAGMTG